ncbi:MAG TPA: hypothetical protein VIV11_18655 [Kofleriaceae bacterium]
MGRTLAVLIGVASLLLLTVGTAEAKIRVAVVAFEGDDNGAVQEVVTDLLDDDYSVSGTKAVNRTVDKLGLEGNLSDKDLKKLANELEVDAILRGDLQQKGSKKLLHIKVYLNGKKVRGFKVEFASMKSEKFKTALKDKIDEKLAGQEAKKKKAAEEPAEPVADEEDPLGGKKGKKGAKTDRSAEKAALKTKTDAVDEEADEKAADKDDDEKSDEEQSGDDEDPDGKKKVASADIDNEDIDGIESGVQIERSSGGRSANVAAVRLDVGPSMSARTLKFNSRNFEEAPKPYQNAPVGGARVAGEIYPLALGNPHSFISGLGIAGHYDKTLKLNLQSTAQPGTKFEVDQKHWGVGLRFRVAFGSSARAPTVTLGGGYFHRVFKVNRSALMEGNIIDLPDVFYKGYDPGLEFRVPIIKQVALLLGGQALLVTDTGQIQKLTSYGRAKITAGQAMAAIDIVIANRVALRISGEMAQYGFAFVGNGEQTYNRDNDPGSPDVGGASDRFIGGAATLAVLY